MTSESLLHIGVRTIAFRGPESPCLAQEFFDDPAVNVAAIVATYVNDQTIAVIVGVEVARETGNIAAGPMARRCK